MNPFFQFYGFIANNHNIHRLIIFKSHDFFFFLFSFCVKQRKKFSVSDELDIFEGVTNTFFITFQNQTYLTGHQSTNNFENVFVE